MFDEVGTLLEESVVSLIAPPVASGCFSSVGGDGGPFLLEVELLGS